MLTSRPTHGGGAPLGIDLDAGVAKITVRRPAAPAEEASDAGSPAAGAEPTETPAPLDADEQPDGPSAG